MNYHNLPRLDGRQPLASKRWLWDAPLIDQRGKPNISQEDIELFFMGKTYGVGEVEWEKQS